MPSSVSASSGMSSSFPPPNNPPQPGAGGAVGAGSPAGGVAYPSFPPTPVPLIYDRLTFDSRQATRLRDMEKQMEQDLKRKKKTFERETERMREEFLKLIPVDHVWGSDELLADPLVFKRRGSTDILNPRKMKTMITTAPDSDEKRFRLRFDLRGFDPDSVRVSADSDRITIRAWRSEESVVAPGGGSGTAAPPQGGDKGAGGGGGGGTVGRKRREYIRKIAKPHDVDHTRLKSRLSADGILVVQAPLMTLPSSKTMSSLTHNKISGPSPSHSFQGSAAGSSGGGAGSPELTPSTMKLGVPIFREEPSPLGGGLLCRRMHLAVQIGTAFKPKEITVQAIKDNRILIKAKHEERTSERLVKNKFNKEFELAERIDTQTLRGGLGHEGRLVVSAFVKGHGLTDLLGDKNGGGGGESGGGVGGGGGGAVVIEQLDPNGELMPCNVLDLASFPPKMSSSVSAISIQSHGGNC